MVSGITVNHPHGVALSAYGCQIRNCSLKGTIKLRRCVADVTSMTSFYPGYALFAAEASTLRVGTLTLGKENSEITGGADDPAAAYLKQVLIAYLNGSGHVSAPKWDPDALKARCGKTFPPFRLGNEVDAGGRPL